MQKHINHLFSIQKDKKRSFPKFLVSQEEPREQPVLDAANETPQALEDEMLSSWSRQKDFIRRYARRLRERSA